MSESLRPIRILQVVGGMNRGGAETWLMHILRNIDRKRFRMDFLVHSETPGAYDHEIRALGGRVIVCSGLNRPWDYARYFRKIVREYGPYDVLHTHVQHFGGYVQYLGARQDIPIRIAHSHLDTGRRKQGRGILRSVYELSMEWAIHRYATIGLGVSADAARALFGRKWTSDDRFSVLYCGIDITPFLDTVESPSSLRSELGIPEEAFVVGHIGRFVEQKNHSFLLEIAQAAITLDPSCHFLLIGEGPLTEEIYRKADLLGISSNITFAGTRADVPDILTGVIDAFVFPSLYEGLGLAVVEAQAAGLVSVVSDTIPVEATVVPELVVRLPLSMPERWAQELLGVRYLSSHRMNNRRAAHLVNESPFSIEKSCSYLQKIYENPD